MQDEWNRKGALTLIRAGGLKKKWVAEQLGITPATLARTLSSPAKPKTITLIALATVLGCSTEFLLDAQHEERAAG